MRSPSVAWLTLPLLLTVVGCGAATPLVRCPGGRSPAPTWPAGPEGDAPAGARVLDVAFEGGEEMPEDVLRRAVSHAPGDALEPYRLFEDARRLYELEVFDDVRVHLDPRDGGVALRFELVPRARIERALVAGEEPHPLLTKSWRALEGGLYTRPRARWLAAAIRDRYRSAGHLHARAAVHARASAEGGVELCLALDAGPTYRIAEVRFPGASYEEGLRALLDTQDGRVNAPGGIFRRDLLEQRHERLLAFLVDRGHVRARVDAPSLRFDREAGAVSVRVPVHEGAVYRIGAILADPPYDALLSSLEPPPPGSVFSRAPISALRERLRARVMLRDPRAEVEIATDLDETAQTVSVRFEITGDGQAEPAPPAPIVEPEDDDGP